MRKYRLLAAAVAIAVTVSACAPTAAPAAPTSTNQTLTIALADVPREQFDPSRGTATAKVYQSLMYDWLIGAQPTGKFDKSVGVAKEWAYSSDGLTFTVTVRDGITFWDGSPLTADDVVFSLQRILDPKATSSGSATMRSVTASVAKAGTDTVELKLKRTYLFLPQLLSRLGVTDGAIVSKKYFETVGEAQFASKPMGSGRYKVASSDGTTYTFERNEKYWLGVKGRFAKIVMQNAPEEQTRLALLQRGDADIVGLSAQAASTLKGDGIKVAVQPGKANLSVNYHEQWKPENPLSDARFREALNLSINRKEMLDTIFFGRGDLAGVPQLGPTHIGFDASKFRKYEYDPARAKQLIAQTGYPANPVQLDVYQYTWPGVPELPQVMEAIAGYFKAVGVNVRLVKTDYNTLRDAWGKFNVGAAVAGNAADNRPVYPIELVWSSGGSLSYTHDPKLDALITAWSTSRTVPDAERALQAVAAYVRDNNIGTSIMIVATLYGLGKNVAPWDGLESVFPFEMSLDGLLTAP
jgi:peptide/nickel transport system substrate-binding protein